MKKIKLPNATLIEVLVQEIEAFKKTKKDYAQIMARNTDHLARLETLYETPIQVDLEEMREEHEAIKTTMMSAITIPPWIIYTLIGLFASLTISLLANYWLYDRNQDLKAHVYFLYDKLEKGKKPRK